MSDFLRGQLYAVRAQIDAMLAQLEPQQEVHVAGSCPQCGAPEDKQVDASTMATPGIKKCMVCQTEYQA